MLSPVEETDQVEDGPELPGPGDLQEERQHHPLSVTLVLLPTPGASLRSDETDAAAILEPVR